MIFPGEEALLSGLKSADEHAVREWYSFSKKQLFSFFLSKTKSSQDAEELTHDTYLSCLASLPLFRGESGLWGWMLSVARHELADYWRKRYAKKILAIFPYGKELLDSFQGEEPFLQSEKTVEIQETLQRLPREVAEILQCKYIDNTSMKDLAKKYDLSFSAMQSKVYRAKIEFIQEYEKTRKPGGRECSV